MQEYQRRRSLERNPNLQLVISAVTGETVAIEKDEIYPLDNHQVPVKRFARLDCKVCFGKGTMGIDPETKYYKSCPKCMDKMIDIKTIQKIQEFRQKRASTSETVQSQSTLSQNVST